MRILLLMDPFIPVPPENYGGIERIVFDMATEYVKMGHRVTIVAGPNSRSPDRLITYGKNGPLNPNINLVHLQQVYKILNKEIKHHDVIHNFGRLLFLSPFLKNKIPKIQSYLREVSRFNIIRTDFLKPVNLTYTAVSNSIKKTGKTNRSTWHTVYNCAPLDQFIYKPDTSPNSYLTFIGRFERCKGLHNAIKVAKLTNRQLIIAGFISHIPEEKRYYEKEIKPHIDGEQIKWIGQVNNEQRNKLLRNASALLTPVEWLEPFPVIIPESYACGTPVLGYALGGIPEGIEQGITGYISNNITEMAAQVLKIDQLSRSACRAKAEKEYGASVIANNYLKIYDTYKPYFHNPLKMKILLIMDPGIPVPPTLYGGIERQVYHLAEEYTRLGHEVTLLAGPGSHCSGETIEFGINDLKRSKVQKNTEIMFVWRYLKTNNESFDLIHNFGRLLYLLPVLNDKVIKIMSYQRQVFKTGIKTINSLPNKNLNFTGCSNYCTSTGNVAGNWGTVYNSIDFSLYQLNKTVAENAPLMFLGRLDRIKGVHTAIMVAKATGDTLLIGGNISHNQDNYLYFKKEIEPLIDNEQIIYLGTLNDARKNMHLMQAKALLFPIEWDEPFGIVMIEAMACGTPVIGFNRGAVPEVIDEGITGTIVNNIDEMIQSVGNVKSFNRENCRDQAFKRFNINTITSNYLSIINDND
ncbi:MAG TPA: glycosyltransferase [Mucilaginibacter sp.]|nr:glycosyltransferase [Mucilaginibacter sp.]